MGRRKRDTKQGIMVLAAQIRTARSRMQLSQGEFADVIGGVSQQQISDWESGKGLRSMAVAIRLLRFLDESEGEEENGTPR
jgi:DNA-binding transcriptional regulator YiaG